MTCKECEKLQEEVRDLKAQVQLLETQLHILRAGSLPISVPPPKTVFGTPVQDDGTALPLEMVFGGRNTSLLL